MSVNNMNPMHRWTALFALIGVLGAIPIGAQTTTFSEDFTGANTTNNWYFFGGACLTAGTTSSSTNPGLVPSCTSLLSSYYSHASSADPYLVGGNSGYLGSSTAPASISGQVPDPVGSGALRFTNGSVLNGSSYQYGFNERGAILSSSTFPTGAGIQVTFKTVTYHGNAGGAGGDGADGISFFLQDGAQAPGLGAFGGSLAYSCSNSNTPHDGLTGGYIGLGIDEYGNFLNGTNLVSGYTGTNVATGDNTAYGYGYKPGRIGLRGACDSHGPRLHDFRHLFATSTLVNWYQSNQEPERRLPLLSAFLGHVHVADTQWYLSASPELMCEAMRRLEHRWEKRT